MTSGVVTFIHQLKSCYTDTTVDNLWHLMLLITHNDVKQTKNLNN